MSTKSHPNAIRTASPIKAWFMSTFCGCRVYTKWQRPTLILLGICIYSTYWELLPATTQMG